MTDLRDKIVGALNIEGAFCGICDREPGQSLYCTACVRVLNRYADAVLAVIDLDKVRAEAQVEALREVAKDREWLDAAARTGMNEYGGPFAGNAAKGVRDWLMRRANRIAREAGIGTGESK